MLLDCLMFDRVAIAHLSWRHLLLIAFFMFSLTSQGFASYPPPPLYYHHYDNMTAELKQMQRNYPNLVTLYSAGKSVLGKELWVLELTADRDGLGIPYVKFVGNIHGNEPLGKELLIHLAKYLLSQYVDGDEEANYILKNTRLHLMPSMNPDGFENSSEGTCRLGPGRGNANGIDLNRNFPEIDSVKRNREESETSAVKNWIASKPFLLSASLHGGALLANYPFDTYRHNSGRRFTRELGEAAETDDDDIFRHLALVYSESHPDMHRGISCKPPHQPVFHRGITNGAAWYPVSGGMQDYNYLYHGCMELTLEIGCCKYPSAEKLPAAWSDNLMPMIKLIEEAQRGVYGVVLDGQTGHAITNAKVKISGRNMTFLTTQRGEYWRILLPGSYFLEVWAEGYKTTHVLITIPKTQYSGNLKPVRQDIILRQLNEKATDETTTEKYYGSDDTSTSYYDIPFDGTANPPLRLDYFRANESLMDDNYLDSSQAKHVQISITLSILLAMIALLQ